VVYVFALHEKRLRRIIGRADAGASMSTGARKRGAGVFLEFRLSHEENWVADAGG